MDDDNFYDPDSARVCKIYDEEDDFTAFVQFLLAAMALSSLWFKRMYEKPKRNFQTWYFDVSKNGFGATYAHILNMIIAAVIADNVRGDHVLEDQCAWYAINFLIDTTLGLVFSVILLNALDRMANEHGWETLKNSGVYVGPDAVKTWLHQLFSWLVILTIVKFATTFILWLFSPILAVVGDILFAPMQSNIRFELLFVMIFFPGILNMFYFWIADSYLQASGEHEGAHEVEDAIKAEENDYEMGQSSQTDYTSMDNRTEVL